jgi:hypothetical protein
MLPHYNFQFPDMTAKISIYLPKFHKLIPIPISLHKTERSGLKSLEIQNDYKNLHNNYPLPLTPSQKYNNHIIA